MPSSLPSIVLVSMVSRSHVANEGVLQLLQSKMNRHQDLIWRAVSQWQQIIQNRNVALAICEARDRIRIEQQS